MCTMNPDDLTSGQRLMTESRHMGVEVKVAADKLDRLEVENAKLRKLLKDYLNAPCVECDPWREGWQGCKHCDGGSCTLATRAIELGIEVEE